MSGDTEVESVVAGGSGISRRALIKGGAIVGATLWVAPVVESFASPASATSYSHGCVVCFQVTSGGLVPFYAGQDDPTQYNNHAQNTCAGNAPAGVTSGVFIVYDSNNSPDPFGSSGSSTCTFDGANLQYCTDTTNVYCPGTTNCSSDTLPPGVFCFTGTWSKV